MEISFADETENMDLEQKPNGRENSFKCFKDNIIQVIIFKFISTTREFSNYIRLARFMHDLM